MKMQDEVLAKKLLQKEAEQLSACGEECMGRSVWGGVCGEGCMGRSVWGGVCGEEYMAVLLHIHT